MKTTPVIYPPRVFEKDTSHLPDAWFEEKPATAFHSNKVIQSCYRVQENSPEQLCWVKPQRTI